MTSLIPNESQVTATKIARGFDRYHHGFEEVTRRASRRFERRDWGLAAIDASQRIDLYSAVVAEVEAEVRSQLGPLVIDRPIWQATKGAYSGLIADRLDSNVAETFFNSVTRRIFATEGVDHSIEYVDSDLDQPPPRLGPLPHRSYSGTDLVRLFESILDESWFEVPFENPRRDARLLAARLGSELAALGTPPASRTEIELLSAPFCRRKGAYLIGRLACAGQTLPLVLALLNGPAGIVVDAALTDSEDVSVLFSFAQSHFHVDLGPPHQVVGYLGRLMPRKSVAELYIAIGYHKHGKTELYRDLLRRARETDHPFDLAPGTPGMIMVVFAMPGYDVVFKIIRDHFPAIKLTTAQAVRSNYQLVFRHDRAGRLVEAHEFERLKFDRALFSPNLIRELESQARRAVEVSSDQVLIRHAYLERRVTPLDIYLADAAGASADAVVDFGWAIKDLAANGIFPGELLPKNFGVTRHGRVVCYDYDELGLLTDFSFRSFPKPLHDDDDLSEEAWFGVGPRDVFPEELRRFIGLPAPLLRVLDENHRDLYEVDFWRDVQARLKRGETIDIFPYLPSRRLSALT